MEFRPFLGSVVYKYFASTRLIGSVITYKFVAHPTPGHLGNASTAGTCGLSHGSKVILSIFAPYLSNDSLYPCYLKCASNPTVDAEDPCSAGSTPLLNPY